MDFNLDDYSGGSRALLDTAFGSQFRIDAFDRLAGFTQTMAKVARDDQLAYRSLGGSSEMVRAAAKLVTDCEIASQATCYMGTRASLAERAIRQAMFDPIMQAQRDLERLYGPIEEILAMQREAETLKAYRQAMEPANLFYDPIGTLSAGASIHQSITEQSAQIALQSQIEHMRSGYDIPEQWSKLGVASHWLSEERKLLDRFCNVASPDLRIGAVGRLHGIWAQQESLARDYFEAMRAQEDVISAFANTSLGSIHLYGDGDRDWLSALSGLSFPDFSDGLGETLGRRPRAKRPYFANRNMYQQAANVGGAIEAVLRDAVNEMLIDKFGPEWISDLLPQEKKSLTKKRESESGHDRCAPLYEYLSLGEVVRLIKRRDLWDACIGELFSAPQEEVNDFLDELTTRNSATHRRSNFREIRMREFLVAARFIAIALQDDDLLDVIDEAEESVFVPPVVH